ncbi:YdgA family protein [Ectopseudomonas composti]|uniref:YdgA family protein n=1 Tax=Ectopseudomonas composti TaxID=658457 RepID=UPI000773B7D0|nr:YdgA family protein [Pseudomonas composti]
MKKTTLAVAIPLAIVGVSVAGAWYTGTLVEQQLQAAVSQANASLAEEVPHLKAQVQMVEFEQGVFSSRARYTFSFATGPNEEPLILAFSDKLEHGPFPPSRLAAGKLAPVMAQSHFSLEQNELTAPLFAAAGGKLPLTGEVALNYDQSQSGRIDLAALQYSDSKGTLRTSPAGLDISVSADRKRVSLSGQLAEFDFDIAESSNDRPVSLKMRDLSLQAEKQKNASGFALGPSSVTIRSMTIQSSPEMQIELQDAVIEEALTQNGGSLDQSMGYRIDRVLVQEQEVGGVKLALSARHLDETALKALEDAYNQLMLSSLEGQEPGSDIGEEFKGLTLALLEGAPVLALDEFSLNTANGQGKAALSFNLRKPADDASSPQELAQSALAALKADFKLDKAVIGDLARVQGTLEGAASGAVDPQALAQQAEMMTEMFSGMALASQWVVEDGNALRGSLTYADDQVTFNGKAMSVAEFMAFAMGSGPGMNGLDDDSELEQYGQE